MLKSLFYALMASIALSACQTAPVTSPTTPGLPLPPDAAASSPALVVPLQRPPRIGLALGGGAARGFAHIGVIQVLEENGIRVDYVAGTSAGSLVAALYASGKTERHCRRSPTPWTSLPSPTGLSLAAA